MAAWDYPNAFTVPQQTAGRSAKASRCASRTTEAASSKWKSQRHYRLSNCDASTHQVEPTGLINAETGCAVKGGGPQRELNPPGNWFAPPGSNQSSSGGNETAEASGAEGR